MSAGRPDTGLGRQTAAVLRWGTLLAVLAIGAGFVAVLTASDGGPGPTPVIDLIGHGGPDALIAIGLLGLTLIPVIALAVAMVALARDGERARALTAAGVLVLLGGSLLAAIVVGIPS